MADFVEFNFAKSVDTDLVHKPQFDSFKSFKKLYLESQFLRYFQVCLGSRSINYLAFYL